METNFSIEVLRKTFGDIAKGFSFGILWDKGIYIKHLSNFDQIQLDNKKQEIQEKVKSIGLPTESEILERLKKEGVWGDKEDAEILTLQNKIDNLVNTKKNLILISQSKQIEEKINQERAKLNSLLFKKKILVGRTQEIQINELINSYYIQNTIFKDSDFLEPFISEGEFNELEDDQLEELNKFYEDHTLHLSVDHIEHLVINNLFLHYFSLIDSDVSILFGKSLHELTFLQLNLIHIALKFRNIFRECGEIPSNIKDNPQKIVELYEKIKKTEKIIGGDKSNINNDEEGVNIKSVVGAKREDLESIGAKTINKNFIEEAKKNGGKLNALQMLKMLNKNI